jgi:hypothetical protein
MALSFLDVVQAEIMAAPVAAIPATLTNALSANSTGSDSRHGMKLLAADADNSMVKANRLTSGVRLTVFPAPYDVLSALRAWPSTFFTDTASFFTKQGVIAAGELAAGTA